MNYSEKLYNEARMVAEYLIPNGFRKLVPTDMNWHPVFAGHYVEVSVRCYSDTLFVVSIMGADDTSVSRWFNSWEEAIATYNKLSYLQSGKDILKYFPDDNMDNSNGWPSDRALLGESFRYPEYEDPKPGHRDYPTTEYR